MEGHTDVEDLGAWLEEGYARSFRTACLIMGNRSDAEEAVQEAFLRAWRFRASLGTGSDVWPWLYRVVVNTCNTKLRQEIPHRERLSSVHDLDDGSLGEEAPSEVASSRDLISALQDLPTHLRIVVILSVSATLHCW